MWTPPPHATVEHTGTQCVVTLRGELDSLAATEVKDFVVKSIRQCPDESNVIIIDMSEVAFIDCAGFGALILQQ
jgi:anti-anti-sigma factor